MTTIELATIIVGTSLFTTAIQLGIVIMVGRRYKLFT